MPENPFLDPSLHVRWGSLKAELVKPAMELALARAEAALAGIERRQEPLDFEGTFLALDLASDELNRTWGRVTHLQAVSDSPELRGAYNDVLPAVSAFFARIPLRADLWRVLSAFARSPVAAGLDPVRLRYMNETIADFREAGAELDPAGKARLESIQAELAQLTQKYSENVLDATNAWQLVVTDECRLEGLPAHAKARAFADASARGLAREGAPAWRFSLHMPSQEPFMTYVHDGELRREMWEAATSVGARAPHDNEALVLRILALRAEKAAVLGRPSFADLVLARRMARSGSRALEFIDGLKSRCLEAFRRECRELEAFKAASLGVAPAPLAPWDLAYWSERLRRERFAFDEEQLREYLPMDRVVGGLFEVCRRVFGIRVEERPAGEVETWHPEVRFYDVFDGAGRHIGSFYADWHPRDSKRAGAWMNGLATGGPGPGAGRVPHLGVVCGNMTPPSAGGQALLTHREAETIFHEFGHLLHHLFGEVEIRSLSGTNVAWDFVELPSQIMENWCWEREGLDLFARHFRTGGRIPEDLFAKMTRARTFRTACATMRQISFARMDLLMHLEPSAFLEAGCLDQALRHAVEDCIIPTEPRSPTIARRFLHLFGDPVGYAAGYYSYKWAEVLDADAFTRFRAQGVFNAAVGADFVAKILSRGNAEDPAALFRAFMGRDPDLAALLERSGLAA